MAKPSQELLDMVAGRDFIDFPTAWRLAEEGVPHWTSECSYEQTHGALLCDCDAVRAWWCLLREQLGLEVPVDERPRPAVMEGTAELLQRAVGGESGVQ